MEPPAKEKPILSYGGPATPHVSRIVPGFDEIEIQEEGDAIVLVHSREALLMQTIAMSVSTGAFIVLVIGVLPKMNLSKTGTILWTIVGVIALAAVGLVTQAQTRSTRIRMDAVGLQIEQGSAMDREHVELTWADVCGVLLEPVSAKDAQKGMQLRIEMRDAEPVDTLVDVGIGDLTEARRMLLERWHQHRRTPPT